MIDNDALESILSSATDLSTVCEIYDSDTVPTDDGLDPADAIDRFAAVNVTFLDQEYKRLVKSFGSIKRTINGEINTCSVTFSNVTREISTFEFTHGFEGLIIVVRLISRSQSTSLDKSQILFVGRCDKPDSGNKEELTVNAKFILGGLDPRIPRRKYTPDDPEGRVSSDPEFEGFLFTPREGTTAYSVRQSKRNPWGLLAGFVGFFFFRKHVTITQTLHWSSYSDLDANKSVPEVFGRAQILGTHIGYQDVGSFLQLRTAFSEGEILEYQNIRSLDTRLTINPLALAPLYGKIGSLNGPDDPGYPAPGYYSRTAHIRVEIDNSTIEDVDPAPDIAAVIMGKKIPIPTAGVWGGAEWTDNAAAITRFLLTSEDYYKLDEAWIDDDYATTCYLYNDEQIFNTQISDFTFVDEG